MTLETVNVAIIGVHFSSALNSPLTLGTGLAGMIVMYDVTENGKNTNNRWPGPGSSVLRLENADNITRSWEPL